MQHPDFADDEERSAQQLALLLERQPEAFLACFGRWLGMVQLRSIAESPHGQLEAVRVALERLTRVVATGDDVSEVTVVSWCHRQCVTLPRTLTKLPFRQIGACDTLRPR